MAQYRDFVEQYMAELQELTFNSKPIITTLTILAAENLGAASSVVAAIERHLSSCPPASKLPVLYLLDSIVKNVREPFVSLFARNIPEVFLKIWLALPGSHLQLRKLVNTWNGLFPPQALAALCRGVAQYEIQQHPNSAQQQPSRPAPPHPAPHQFQYPAVPLQHPAQNIFAPGMPQMPAYPSHVPRPYAIPGQPSLPPHPIAQYPVVNSFHSMGQAPQAPALLNAPSPPRSNAPLPASAQLPADQVPQIGSSTALASLLASLVQAGSLAVPGPPAEQPRQPSSTPPPATPQTTADIPSSGALSPEQVKRLLQADCFPVVQELGAKSAAVRSQHLDQWYLKRRRAQEQQKSSRRWFVDADTWLLGTTTDPKAIPDFFEEGEQKQGREPPPSEPADDSQPNCGLSGEKFEAFWDEEREEWRYRDAKRLTGEEADRYGVADGTLVKVGCLGSSTPAASLPVQDGSHDEAADEIAASITQAAQSSADPDPIAVQSTNVHPADVDLSSASVKADIKADPDSLPQQAHSPAPGKEPSQDANRPQTAPDVPLELEVKGREREAEGGLEDAKRPRLDS